MNSFEEKNAGNWRQPFEWTPGRNTPKQRLKKKTRKEEKKTLANSWVQTKPALKRGSKYYVACVYFCFFFFFNAKFQQLDQALSSLIKLSAAWSSSRQLDQALGSLIKLSAAWSSSRQLDQALGSLIKLSAAWSSSRQLGQAPSSLIKLSAARWNWLSLHQCVFLFVYFPVFFFFFLKMMNIQSKGASHKFAVFFLNVTHFE